MPAQPFPSFCYPSSTHHCISTLLSSSVLPSNIFYLTLPRVPVIRLYRLLFVTEWLPVMGNCRFTSIGRSAQCHKYAERRKRGDFSIILQFSCATSKHARYLVPIRQWGRWNRHEPTGLNYLITQHLFLHSKCQD